MSSLVWLWHYQFCIRQFLHCMIKKKAVKLNVSIGKTVSFCIQHSFLLTLTSMATFHQRVCGYNERQLYVQK